MRGINSQLVSIVIELRQIRYFVCIAELEHFGQAARQLHIVQPALTRQIKQLEEELNVELFERLPRGVRLTPAGKVLLERARDLLAEFDRMVSATKLAAEGKTGFLRIGFADGATYSGHVPALIREFRMAAPEVELELLPASSRSQGELLARQSIDLGFVYWVPSADTNVTHMELNREKVLLAVADTNKLAHSRKSLKLKDLHEVPFVWFKRSNAPAFYDLMASECNKVGLVLNVVQEAFTESTMLSLVAADIGATFITEAALRRKPDNVVLLRVQDLDATITLKAMWRNDDQNPALREFVKVLRTSGVVGPL